MKPEIKLKMNAAPRGALLSLSTKPLCEQRRGANYTEYQAKTRSEHKMGYIQYKTTKADDPF